MTANNPQDPTSKTVLFVCPHGAGKSRMAAAFFAASAPPGWRATTAGLHPAAAVSSVAVQLLAGSPQAPLLDHEPPRDLAAVSDPALIVSIDCDAQEVQTEPAGGTNAAAPEHLRWELTEHQMNEAMRDELHSRARALADMLR